MQPLPYAVGAHPGLPGQFSVLRSADGPGGGVVYLERFTGDLFLEKPSDAQHYGVLYDHLQAEALDPDSSRDLINDVTKTYISAASHP